MSILFDSFQEWKEACERTQAPPWKPVLEYEIVQKNREESFIWEKLEQAYAVMKDAVQTGLTEDMTSFSGMVKNGAKKVINSPISVLGPQFQKLIAYSLAAKEVNSCMGRIVAAPTAGASGIMPGVLVMMEELHEIEPRKLHEGMLVSAGIALIIEKRASIAGAVGGCQAETGTAAAMAAGAIVYTLGGDLETIFESVAITIMNMLGLICDPVAGLVEVPCVKRNGSAAVIAFASAQIALAGDSAMIPVDEVIDAMGEVGASMEDKYKETALGGIANTPTAREIEARVLVQEAEQVEEEI
ncbi:L-serine ammonia-lyase, iron-sulfur-dependent, subunit alpha [Pontibacter sp. G13]|uniref:L-serine ammonia-lyase, iron-sulfur-dependent, subunit alpha n=1 Tax=Pontibacter sp. G13 TaxID=3074898 RepID=UPI002889526C|nr:L-serine ammonia-lyase, iron-sulfur-dependent, subunit alpha [Pontibacter sp. G13]WNJ17762.1 L-serine ammonia-lyase, iron-sulfur-dependent, subunit alpha [Pontibacter sp. G13]